MSMLNEIAAYLEAGNIGLTAGLNLFAGYMPSDPGICVGLIDAGGDDDVRTFVKGTDGIVFEQPDFQVQVRDTNYDNAMSTMLKIKGRINGKGNQKLPDSSGTVYGSILAQGNVIFLQRFPDEDTAQLIVLAQHFQARRKWSAA